MSLGVFRRCGTLYLRDILALINQYASSVSIVVCLHCRLNIPFTQLLQHLIEGHGQWRGKRYITIASAIECICGKYWLAANIYAFIDHLWNCANVCMPDVLKVKLLKNRKSKAGLAVQYIGRRWSRMYDLFGVPLTADPFTFHINRMEILQTSINGLRNRPTNDLQLLKIMHDIEAVRNDFERFKIFQMNNVHFDSWLRVQMLICNDWPTMVLHLRMVSDKAEYQATRFTQWLEVERKNLELELRKRQLLGIDDKESLIWLELHHQCNAIEMKQLVDIDEKQFVEAIKSRGVLFNTEDKKSLLRKQDVACRLSAKSHAVMISISYLEMQVNIRRQVY